MSKPSTNQEFTVLKLVRNHIEKLRSTPAKLRLLHYLVDFYDEVEQEETSAGEPLTAGLGETRPRPHG